MKNLDYKNENIGNEYKRVMHSKRNNIKFTSYNDKLFDSLHLKKTRNSYFPVTPKNHRLKKNVCFYNIGEENF